MAVKINQHLIEKHAHSILIPSSTFCEGGLAAARFSYLMPVLLNFGLFKTWVL